MIIQASMALVKVETKTIKNDGGKETKFKMATLADNDGNIFECSLSKDSKTYELEGIVGKDGTATLDIFVDQRAKTSKAGNPYIANILKMRCVDFGFAK